MRAEPRAARRRLLATLAGLALLALPGSRAVAQPACEPALQATPGADAAAPTRWDEDAVRASRRVLPAPADAGHLPAADDLHDRMLVVEPGGDRVAVVDGKRLELLQHLSIRPALLGTPQRTPDGRYAFVASRTGWISKLDLGSLSVVAEVRAGQRLRGLALSSDGRWLLAGNEVPASVRLFDADLNLVRQHVASALDGRHPSAVSALADGAPRRSFVVAFEELAELWEISYDPWAEPIYDGLVHDYKMGEGIAKPGYLNVRRTPLEAPFSDLWFDPGSRHVLGRVRAAAGVARARVQVVQLDVRRPIAEFTLAGEPRLGAAAPLQRGGTPLLAIPNAAAPAVDLLERGSWRSAGSIATPGPGCFVRAAPQQQPAWADAMLAADAPDRLVLVGADAHAPATVLRTPGRVLGPVAFTRDGRHALVGVGTSPAALVVYDTRTLAELRRLPVR